MTDRAFEKWVAELPTEARYSFDIQGRGYKKDASVMMRLSWQAAIAHERELCAKVCESLGMTTNGIYERNQECADAIRKGDAT